MKRKLFTGTWSYAEGFIIAGLLPLLAFIIEYSTGGKGVQMPGFPTNLSLILGFTIFIVALNRLEEKSRLIRFLGSVPAAISSTVLLSIMAILLGSLPQQNVTNEFLLRSGLANLSQSYWFLFAYLYFLLALGLATVKRIWPLTKKNMGFLLSHLGLYLIIVSAIAGSGDLKRLYFVVYENGKPVDVAFDPHNDPYKMPISLQLLDFKIEEYPPKLVLVDNIKGTVKEQQFKTHLSAEQNAKADLEDWTIEVVSFFAEAHYNQADSLFEPSSAKGAVPVAFVKATHQGGDTLFDWLTSGNYMYQRKSMYLDNEKYLAMLSPDVKTYHSQVRVTDKTGQQHTIDLKVNQPQNIDGWELYQTGYDQEKGKWSEYSVIEAGNDPWLPIVYVGIFMLMGGAIYIFWIGKDVKEQESPKNIINKQ